jgi:glycosyltransferase involved in cell wall biosynthesis
MQPLVSVIIPARNEEKYIQRTLESVRDKGLSAKEIEVVVVCDSCTDKTAEVVKRHRGVRLFSTNARKPSVAKNKGAEQASSDNLIFLDADTTLSYRAIRDILKELDKDRAGTLGVKPYPRKPFAQFLMFFKNLAFATHLYPGSNGLIFCRKPLFKRLGGFDRSLSRYEDGDFMHRAVRLARYSFIRTSYVETSIRRLEKKGYFSVMFFWVIVWFRHLQGKKDGGEYEVVR